MVCRISTASREAEELITSTVRSKSKARRRLELLDNNVQSECLVQCQTKAVLYSHEHQCIRRKLSTISLTSSTVTACPSPNVKPRTHSACISAPQLKNFSINSPSTNRLGSSSCRTSFLNARYSRKPISPIDTTKFARRSWRLMRRFCLLLAISPKR